MNSIHQFVKSLITYGVEDVVISPGSRSTPLAVLIDSSVLNTYIAVDERSGSYMALGLSKAKNKPAALLCTSGTAAANYYPAILEASYSEIPLLVITADRPIDAIGIGSPQTIDQRDLFGKHVKYRENLNENTAYTNTVVHRAFAAMMTAPFGVSHINVPIEDPFMDLIPIGEVIKKDTIIRQQVNCFDSVDIPSGNGLILCGPTSYPQNIDTILTISELLSAPVLADPLSNVRKSSHHNIIDVYDAILNDSDRRAAVRPDYILILGRVMVSKRVQLFMTENKEIPVIQIGESSNYQNIALSTTHQYVGSLEAFRDGLEVNRRNEDYCLKWQVLQSTFRKKLKKCVFEETVFEGKLVSQIQKYSDFYDVISTGNSTIIRSFDAFYEKGQADVTVYCNRGTNGIEGTISTALGVAAAGNRTLLVTGDLSFHHDMNGLLLGKMNELSLMIVLVNNQGGGIFQYLPQRNLKSYERLFQTSPNCNFKGLTEMYGIEYRSVSDWDSFHHNMNELLPKCGIRVLEVNVNSELSCKLHKEYLK